MITVRKGQSIAVVTPVYNEEEGIELFYKEISEHLKKLPETFEIIFVDDGSKDDSAEKILALKPTSIPFRLVRLSRNFGKEAAVSAGLSRAVAW